MTPEAQRIAIAEARGWTFDKRTPNEKVIAFTKRWLSSNKHDTNHYFCPDYLNDLNSCAGFRKSLTFSQRLDFDGLFLMIVSRDAGLNHNVLLALRECYDATALQRCEAFLRTIGKWEESV